MNNTTELTTRAALEAEECRQDDPAQYRKPLTGFGRELFDLGVKGMYNARTALKGGDYEPIL